MFQFPGFALKTLCIQVISTCLCSLLISKRVTITNIQVGCPIQKSMDQSLFSAPHGLSQSITSFIASYCLGIHQTPFSRLIWSRKSQTDLRQNVKQPADNTLVHMLSLSLVKSHTFPPEYMSVHSDYERHKALGLVYLTWTTLFISARDTNRRSRKDQIWMPPWHRSGTKLRSSRHFGRSNSVDNCISLNDVKRAV